MPQIIFRAVSRKLFSFLVLFLVCVGLGSFGTARAQTRSVSDLKDEIATKNVEIERLNQEIAQYERVLTTTQKESQTLDKALRELQATQKKLTAQIKLTEQKISAVNLNIEKTLIEISNKEKGIDGQMLGIGQSMKQIYIKSQRTLF